MKTISISTKQPEIIFISDIHGNKESIRSIVDYLQTLSFDCIILGGDIPDFTKATFTFILKQFLKCDVPIILFPGSHENSERYDAVISLFKDTPLLIDAKQSSNQRIRFGLFELLIIPGSSVVSSGTKPYNGGNMYLLDEKNTPSIKRNVSLKLKKKKFAKRAEPFFMTDIRKMIARKTIIPRKRQIVFTHEPPLFSTKRAIDTAQFGIPTESFDISMKEFKKNKLDTLLSGNTERTFSTNSRIPLKEAKILKEKGYPMKLYSRNVGNPAIKKLLQQYSLTKLLCGHIHEGGPKAIDSKEYAVKNSTWNKTVFINNGLGSEGNITHITLRKDGALKHRFIKVPDNNSS
ncbi:MAG: metallophosphoesterase family protein [Nanobdellota archaeon]